MAYEPTVWKTGDIVSSEKLNKIENSIANTGILVVNVTPTVTKIENNTFFTNGTVDKTYDEMLEAYNAGKLVVVYAKFEYGSGPADVSAILMYDTYMGGEMNGNGLMFTGEAYFVSFSMSYNKEKISIFAKKVVLEN